MHTRPKCVLAMVVAATALLLAAGSAGARILEVSNPSFRWVMRNFTLRGGGLTIVCPVTMEGSFHSRTIAKTAGLLVGHVTRAEFQSPCEGTNVRALSGTLPWHLQYDSFTGTLPNIETVYFRIVGMAFSIEIFGQSCLYQSLETRALRIGGRLSPERVVTTVFVDERFLLPRFSGSISCPSEITISGSGTMTLLGSSTQTITISLI